MDALLVTKFHNFFHRRKKYCAFSQTLWQRLFIPFVYCSVAQSCLTLCDLMDCSTPGFLILHYLLELAQTHVHRVGDDTQPSHPLSSPSLPALNLSRHQDLLQWVISSHQYWSFNVSISPCSEYSGLISFRMDWFDLLAVQGTLKSSLQDNSKASVLQCSAFLMVPA